MVTVDRVGFQVAEAPPQPFLEAQVGKEMLKEDEPEYDVSFCGSNRTSMPSVALPRTAVLLSFISWSPFHRVLG